jgi:hypothetical protein
VLPSLFTGRPECEASKFAAPSSGMKLWPVHGLQEPLWNVAVVHAVMSGQVMVYQIQPGRSVTYNRLWLIYRTGKK